MEQLPVKLVLTPLLIGLTSLVGRRWGPGVGGWLAGLPLTSGPVSVFLAVEQGPSFAARAAVGTLEGLAGVAGFCLAYSYTARRAGLVASTVAGLGTFLVATALLTSLRLSLLPAFAGIVVVLRLFLMLMPPDDEGRGAGIPPGWDTPVRMIVATAMVLGLTWGARALGPSLSGLLSPFPVFANVLAAFTHHREGVPACIRLLRGVLVGSFAFAVFFLVVGALLPSAGAAGTYPTAGLAALLVNAISLRWLRQRP
jgi:hypothetical protein